MKVLIINSCFGCLSTGTIASHIAKDFIRNGDEVVAAYGRSYKDTGVQTYKIGRKKDVLFHEFYTFLCDRHGFGSKKATKQFLEWAEHYDPDLLWIHNIHGFYINIEMLFEWIKSRPNMKVNWTLHDCWAFTGHCSHFTRVKCYKWKSECCNCPQKHEYPKSLFIDNSRNNYIRKKKSFTGVKDLTIITPSKWLAKLVKDSYLGDYRIDVVYNTIDNSIFRPTESDFKDRYRIKNKIMLLGVASTWSRIKGLAEFIQLRSMLNDDYVIVLVGLNKKQIKKLPTGIIGIERTANPQELAKIYTVADLFINLGREETFGLTTLEAISCGTKAIVYRNTACEEVAEQYGQTIADQDIHAVYNSIICLTKNDA